MSAPAPTLATTSSSREAPDPKGSRDLLWRWWARIWLHSQRMGGNDRGVHVHTAQCSCGWDTDAPALGTEWTVTSRRNSRVGVYYPPTWSAEFGEDHEGGGLHPARTVVIVTVRCCECWETIDVMSGDLEPLT